MSEDDSVKHEGKWIRGDFPASLPDAEGVYGPSILVPSVRRDLAAWLNAHHPKPEPDKWRAEWVAVSEDLKAARRQSDLAHEQWQKWEGQARRAEAERDAAIARAEKAGRALAEEKRQHSDTIQVADEQYTALMRERDDAVRERCYWKDRADQLRDERDEAVADLLDAGRVRDEWEARAEKAEADRENIAEEFADFRVEVVAEAVKYRESNPQASGDDPVVYAVRESDIAAVEVEKVGPRIVCGGQSSGSPEASRIAARNYLQKATDCEAMARELETIEVEQAVDQVEEKAISAFKVAWHEADMHGDEGNRTRRGIRAARKVIEGDRK